MRPCDLEEGRQAEVEAVPDHCGDEARPVARGPERQRSERKDGEGNRHSIEDVELDGRVADGVRHDPGSDGPDDRQRQQGMDRSRSERRAIARARRVQDQAQDPGDQDQAVGRNSAGHAEIAPVAVEGRADQRGGEQPRWIDLPGQIGERGEHGQRPECDREVSAVRTGCGRKQHASCDDGQGNTEREEAWVTPGHRGVPRGAFAGRERAGPGSGGPAPSGPACSPRTAGPACFRGRPQSPTQ